MDSIRLGILHHENGEIILLPNNEDIHVYFELNQVVIYLCKQLNPDQNGQNELSNIKDVVMTLNQQGYSCG